MNAIGSHLPADASAPRLRIGRLHVGIVDALLGAALAGAGVGAYLAVGAAPPPAASVRTATVAKGVVLSTVSATGALQAPLQLAVDFQSGGVLTSVRVKPGQHVRAGQALGTIDAAAARQAVSQALAALQSANAQLETTRTGETPQQRAQDTVTVAQARQAVASARAALAQAKHTAQLDTKGSTLSMSQAQTQLRTDLGQEKVDVAKNETDEAGDGTVDAVDAAIVNDKQAIASAQDQQQTDQQTQYTLQEGQTTDNNKLSADKTSLSNAQATDNTPAIATATNDIAADQVALDNDASALTSIQKQLSIDSYTLSQAQAKLSADQAAQTTLEADRNAVRADEQKAVQDRNAIESARNGRGSTSAKDAQSIQNARQQVTNAQLSLRSTRASIAAKTAPTPAALASAQAGVVQAQASLASARRTLAQTTLRAPVAGVVAAVNGSTGTTVAGGGTSQTDPSASSSSSSGSGSSAATSAGFITLTGLTGLQVVAAFAETDAARLAPGQPATITVDALPSRELAAHVLSIAQNASSSSGVVTYDVTFALDRSAPALKPGMTVDVDVVVGEADGVLHVPTAALRGSGTNASVVVLRKGKQVTLPVVAGLRGDTATAILGGGLKAGDRVVLPSVTIASSGTGAPFGASTTPATGGGSGGGGGIQFRVRGGGFGGGFGG